MKQAIEMGVQANVHDSKDRSAHSESAILRRKLARARSRKAEEVSHPDEDGNTAAPFS
jgi:hypothetical protein